jgi:hypothetical protein
MLLRLRIMNCYGRRRLVEWIPDENMPGWGRYRIVWPRR